MFGWFGGRAGDSYGVVAVAHVLMSSMCISVSMGMTILMSFIEVSSLMLGDYRSG